MSKFHFRFSGTKLRDGYRISKCFFTSPKKTLFPFRRGHLNLTKNLPNNPANEVKRLHGGCVYVQVVLQESMEEKRGDLMTREHLVLVSSFFILVLTLENQIDLLLRSAIQLESSLGSHTQHTGGLVLCVSAT